ncbi:MAG TPA: LPXTG cell wall anchor domain-containing protein [Nanoarchaeota archaeon]|nr:LPXTG cell wall anchor domain-containing protein [Candidatus Woesearchaeota archaeon]HIH59198.1 LPXTG cell wall anchor domain-containing protein [Nanoarchaeota archaeon]HII13487.1 LPXTG cell wall anchor domain-containing protein [Nanoarchaeota archaeon]HIJ05576.1 LPXTG cell wall anchor domain-containing protein [Nanoarchaeota archaeon]
MNKTVFGIFLVVYVILSLSLITAHAEESHEEEVDGKIISLEFLPFEPKAGSATILSFEVNDAEGKSVTHIDGLLDIKKDGQLLVDDYELHSHGNQFSMSYKFPEEGKYTATLTVQPSEHYENEKFDSLSVVFYITVEEAEEENNNTLYLFGIVAGLAILAILVFTLKKKKPSF